MGAWRSVGLNYINFSTICARSVRRALIPKLRAAAERRDESDIRYTPWLDGKPQRHLTTGVAPPGKK